MIQLRRSTTCCRHSAAVCIAQSSEKWRSDSLLITRGVCLTTTGIEMIYHSNAGDAAHTRERDSAALDPSLSLLVVVAGAATRTRGSPPA